MQKLTEAMVRKELKAVLRDALERKDVRDLIEGDLSAALTRATGVLVEARVGVLVEPEDAKLLRVFAAMKEETTWAM